MKETGIVSIKDEEVGGWNARIFGQARGKTGGGIHIFTHIFEG